MVEDRKCPNCGRVIPIDARLCPYCAKKFEETHQMVEEKRHDNFIKEIVGKKHMNALKKLRIIITMTCILSVLFIIITVYAGIIQNAANADALKKISSNDLQIYKNVQSSLPVSTDLYLIPVLLMFAVIVILFILMIKLWMIKKL